MAKINWSELNITKEEAEDNFNIGKELVLRLNDALLVRQEAYKLAADMSKDKGLDFIFGVGEMVGTARCGYLNDYVFEND